MLSPLLRSALFVATTVAYVAPRPTLANCEIIADPEPAEPTAWGLPNFIAGPPGGVWWLEATPDELGSLTRNAAPFPVEVVEYNEAATAIRIPFNAQADDVFLLSWARGDGGLVLPVNFEIDAADWPIATPLPERVEGYTREVFTGGQCGDLLPPPGERPEPVTSSLKPYVDVFWGMTALRKPFPSSPPDFLLNVWMTPQGDAVRLDPRDRIVAARNPRQFRSVGEPDELRFRVEDPGAWTMTIEFVDLVTGRRSPPASQDFEVSLEAVGAGCSSTTVAPPTNSALQITFALSIIFILMLRRRIRA